MRYLIKNIYNPNLLSALFLSASFHVASGQAVAPANNKPDNSTLPTGVIPYPGIRNLNSNGKFNYVRTIIPDQPVQAMSGTFYKRQVANYFDGLGRPLQTVAKKGHADGNDLVSVHVYDSSGRETYQYLPYAAPTGGIYLPGFGPGGIKLQDSTQMRGFYEQLGADEQPYSKTIFENSPLGRPIKQMGAGKSWVGASGGGRGITFDYKSNGPWSYFYTIARSIGNAYPRYSIGPNNTDIPVYAGTYGTGELAITVSTDEDGKNMWEWKDKNGLVVARMQQATDATSNLHPTDYAYTFYVYDELNRLRCVMPPEAVKPHKNADNWSIYWDTPTSNIVAGLCYTYFYDGRSRLIEKKVPGKDVEYYIYDKRDRQVFYQDGNLRVQNKWNFVFYNGSDQPTVTGIGDATISRTDFQAMVDNATAYTDPAHWLYYVKNYNLYHAYPTTTSLNSCKILSFAYYDDYSQNDLSAYSYNHDQFAGVELPNNNTVIAAPISASTMTRGLPTGGKVRIMDPDHPNEDSWLISVTYYDDKGHVIQTQSQNMKGGLDISSNLYYFQGMLYKNILKHQNPDEETITGASDDPFTLYKLINTFERNLSTTGGNDHVWLHKQRINSGIDYYLSAYDYDHLGRVVLKQFTAGANYQDYTMHGFLDDIIFNNFNTDTLFQERLFYDKGFASKLYNGNIAGIIWAGQDEVKKAYGYTYDPLNRLSHAEFSRLMPAGTGGLLTPHWDKSIMDYTVSNLTYDLNGNIKTMNQMVKVPGLSTPASFMMDQLTYAYAGNSNRLIKVTDAVLPDNTANWGLPDFKDGSNRPLEYQYDNNGNLRIDENKKIGSIDYNYLNKPERVTLFNNDKVTYVYDAAGNRLQKRVQSADDNIHETWDYIGNFVYKDNQLQYILNDEGRARPIPATGNLVPANSETPNPTIFVYDYFVKDHLGNVRSTVTSTPASQDYAARHEIASANIEELIFDNIPLVRDDKPGSITLDDKYAARLNAGETNKSIGTAIMLRVNANDRLHFSVKAFYEGEYVQKDDVGMESLVESLMSTLLGGQDYTGVPISELPENAQIVQNIFSNPELASQMDGVINNANDPDAPNAHLNYLWFNDDLQLEGGYSGSIQVPQNVNGIGSWATLGNGLQAPATGTGGGSLVTPWNGGDFVAPSSGILVVYIDNQTIGQDVWFDDLFVTNYNSEVMEEDHYYPFGLTLNTTTMQTGVAKQPYKLTTKELESNFDLNMYDFGARQFDMQRGQWTTMDPLAEKYASYTPYNYVMNNPVRFNDPDGRNAVQVVDKEHQTITITAVYYVQTKKEEGQPEGQVTKSYNVNDLKHLNKIDDDLNKKGYTVTEGDYAGYTVKFDLQFKDGGTLTESNESAKKESINGVPTGNAFTISDEKNIPRFVQKYDEHDQPTTQVGGYTRGHKEITMNQSRDQFWQRVHEMFHTFFFDKDNADNGIGAYYKMGTVNQNDINILINNPLLPKTTSP